MNILNGLLIMLLILLPLMGQGQNLSQPLPEIQISRRANGSYLDSLSQVAKKRYSDLTRLTRTAQTDTLRFKALYYLGRLYKIWSGRRDSTRYFSNELVAQAHQSNNLFYELNGKLSLAEYYRSNELNTPLALRLNLEILPLIPATVVYKYVRFQTNVNLGSLYTLSRDYPNALRHLSRARNAIIQDTIYRSPKVYSQLIDLEQHIGAIYNQQDNFAESERHYRIAEAMLAYSTSPVEHGYVYDDLAELYCKFQRYEQALPYAKKAESIWNRLKAAGESQGWGTLATVYAGLGQDELAYQYAQYVLQLRKPTKFILEQAYKALYQVFERKGDWKNSSLFYKKYIVVRDTIAYDQRTFELTAIQKQAEFDNIALENRQAHELQAQRLLTLQQQAELNQLRATAQAEALTKKAQLSEQQRRFDRERANAMLNRQQTAQALQRQAFEQQTLQQENKAQQNLIFYLVSSFLFIVGLLTLLLYMAQLRKRKAEADLRLASERREANARIIQTQETERQRIAADLHDDLGGTIATLRRRLADISQHTTDTNTQRAFADAEPLIQKSSDDLRRISHNLMPPEFVRIGLRHALEQLVRNQPLQPTRFTFVVSGVEQRLPVDIELNAYRIVSELIQNINKHAHADRAAVQLLYQNDKLTITVDDDGLGSRTIANMNESAGIGLKNSSLRAEYIGATLWRDASEAGTLVVLDIPYPTPMYAARTSLPNSLN
ncbi:histidine kinase [uncultured Fibrella sp.]|uniref:tetratricopeptide repeat-containing sensor histidine kinase n=1 Tax=uncultured Fibrella sp. TaxID=1284596 RepID=UPI0035CC7232